MAALKRLVDLKAALKKDAGSRYRQCSIAAAIGHGAGGGQELLEARLEERFTWLSGVTR